MSTRSYTTGSLASERFDAYWNSGDNGRTEISSGETRDKWNAYSMRTSQSRSSKSDAGTYAVQCREVNIQNSLITPPDIINICQARLLSKIKLHDFNLGVAIGEGKQAVDMVDQTARTIVQAARAVRHGDLISATRILARGSNPLEDYVRARRRGSHFIDSRRISDKDFANKWIELQYGWVPLLSDCFEASVAFAALTAKRRKSLVVAKSKGIYTWTDTVNNPYYVVDGTLTYRHRIQYEMSEALSAPRQLGLIDPLSIAWELTPFSFIADWFLPIGIYLENLNQIPKLEGRFLTTRKWDWIGDTRILPAGKTWSNINNGKSHIHSFSLTRVPSVGLSTAYPSFVSLPDALSPVRIANAIALLRQRI